jgi:3-deoxy-D-manno-octulosonic acid (KDO) 8-phosphate synthase
LKPNQPAFFCKNLEIVRTRSTTRQEVFVYKGKFLEPQPRVPSTFKKKVRTKTRGCLEKFRVYGLGPPKIFKIFIK